ncbi:hypothetical protein K2173_027388 [Erythroxylum novogranatense]|uniref:Dof zinc finger protein n=1 Tax=Erythroxylum novogranatense TaxID=1862640 RepID=A0AAV8TYY0_9ROSI|nr:hypothetical protein K2173_027388 [Erythroxylum novogranatense]
MQDIHSIGGGGSLFAGGGGDRRLRPYHNQNHQALKCPRCDSLNTKFCYYNNYNLSQPRHFCKSCRRYWTNGGVLRNVPVGGGCRKTKRSKPKQQTPYSPANTETIITTTVTATTSPTPTTVSRTSPPQNQQEREGKSWENSHSSSESLSLTTTTNTAAALDAASAHSTSPAANVIGGSNVFCQPSLELLEHGSTSDYGIFSEIGSFSSLINTSSVNEQLQLGFSNVLNQQTSVDNVQHWQQQKLAGLGYGGGVGEEMKMHEIAAGGLIDQTVHLDYSRSGNGGFGALDWQGGGDHQGLFHLYQRC